MTPPRLPEQVSTGSTCRILRSKKWWQRLRRGVGRQKQTAVQVAILRDCHPHPRVQKGGREAQRSVRTVMSLPAASLTASGQPASQASLPQRPARPRPPLDQHHQKEEMEGGWTLLLLHSRRGSAVEKKNIALPYPAYPASSLLLCFVPHAAIAHSTHTQASSSGGNSSMPALPLAWNLANRSPNVDHSPSSSHASHTLSHTRTLSPARAEAQGPKAPSPAAGYHLPSSLIASHRVQACSRVHGLPRGAPSHRSKRFLFSLGHPAPRPTGLFRGIRCKQPGSSRQS